MLTDDEIEQKSSHGPVKIHQQVIRPTDGASGEVKLKARIYRVHNTITIFVEFC